MRETFDWKFGFQDPVTPVMEGIIDLHNHIFFFLIVIFVTVASIFYATMKIFFYDFHFPKRYTQVIYQRAIMLMDNRVSHGTNLEIIWTITPSIILVLIAIPSFSLLYSMEEVLNPSFNFKVIGHQWYWAYEIPDISVNVYGQEFILPMNTEANITPDDELIFGEHRLLTTDYFIEMPADAHIRTIVTSMDVLHSWAIPAFGVKIDAVPGRLNQTFMYLQRTGIFYGQCSELCGVSHGFMPIVIRVIPHSDYADLVDNAKAQGTLYFTRKLDMLSEINAAKLDPLKKAVTDSLHHHIQQIIASNKINAAREAQEAQAAQEVHWTRRTLNQIIALRRGK